LIGVLITAVAGWVGVVLTKRMSRRHDESATRLNDLRSANEDLSRMRALVDEIDEMMERQRKHLNQQLEESDARLTKVRAQHEADMAEMVARLDRMDARDRALREALAVHTAWDIAAIQELRERIRPDWPGPPPLDGGDR
jgi:ABC-type phosphate transport system auxiliary subunit